MNSSSLRVLHEQVQRRLGMAGPDAAISQSSGATSWRGIGQGHARHRPEPGSPPRRRPGPPAGASP